MRRKGIGHRILAFVAARRGDRICTACVAREVEESQKTVHEAFVRAEAFAGYRRGYGRCSVCQRTRLVVSFGQPSPRAS